ncbi:hypothetical protein HK405_014032 [Cladochytrium tenue]|nr:hypothetical protein HK405_014032 [Cladochytrium tenue]
MFRSDLDCRALAELEYADVDIVTPTDSIYRGKRLASEICTVSILRSGSTMEDGVRQVVQDAPVGKLLIQSDASTGEARLHYCKLPADIAGRHVLVTDATVATGAAALMAVRVILDHGVPEDRVLFLCLLAAPHGLHAVARAFPGVRVVTSAVDADLSDRLHILPGIGTVGSNFGDRYFGTDE